jgi:transposase
MHAIVHAADIQDRDGGVLLMATLFGLYPFLLSLYADGGYQGAGFQGALRTILKRVNVEIVKRSDQARRFVVLPKRWLVERTFAWLGRCRRLAKDWECLNRKALAFLKLASIRLSYESYAIQDNVSGQTLRAEVSNNSPMSPASSNNSLCSLTASVFRCIIRAAPRHRRT